MLTINADDLPRFMACNGSRLMAGEIPPSSDTSLRDEGTAAHHMAVQVFAGHHTLEELIDRKAPNGVYMTSEMAQHVNDYLQLAINDATLKQMEVDTSHNYGTVWAVNGRADFILQFFNSTLRITDFKYGWRIVEPENNWTLISHAIGICKQRGFEFSNIELQIFQPRPYHPDGALRTWAIPTAHLVTLDMELSRVLTHPLDELHTSAHCANCPALATCPAARKAEMNSIDATDTVFSDTVSNELLSFSLDNLNRASEMIKERKKAFEELAQHRIKAGQVVDNYSVGIGYGHSKFKEGIDGAMLQMLTGQKLTIETTVTPAEAKRRGVPEDILKSLTERPVTGVKLERVKASTKAKRLLNK